MKKILVGIMLVLLCATPAFAIGPVLNRCTAAWVEIGGNSNLASFNVYLALTSGGPYALLVNVPAGSGTAYTTTGNACAGQPDGQKFAIVKALDIAGNESSASNEFPFALLTVPQPAPGSLRFCATAVCP